MIPINELRVGNCINEQGLYLHVGMIHQGLFDASEPILLTEEIMVEWCGFTHEPNSATEVNDGEKLFLTIGNRVSFMVEPAQGYFYFSIENNLNMGYSSMLRSPEYLHELQNLIHAYTGEELQIKIKL